MKTVSLILGTLFLFVVAGIAVTRLEATDRTWRLAAPANAALAGSPDSNGISEVSEMSNNTTNGASPQALRQMSGEGDERRPGRPLFDFTGREPGWYTVDDDVMGGASSSAVSINENPRRLTFSGNVSLDNNGGFASTRSQWAAFDLSDYDGIAMRVRGDGNVYRLRIRTDSTVLGISYTAWFRTEPDTWQEIYVPFEEMVPMYRGFVVNAAGPLNPVAIRSFGLMVSDKQSGEFQLDVEWIHAVATQKHDVKLLELKVMDIGSRPF